MTLSECSFLLVKYIIDGFFKEKKIMGLFVQCYLNNFGINTQKSSETHYLSQ